MKEVKDYCIARSHPAQGRFYGFYRFQCIRLSTLSSEKSRPFLSLLARYLFLSLGVSAVFERYLNYFANAFDKDLSVRPHFPGRDMIQAEERSYRVLPAASGIYNFSRQ